MQPLPLLKFYGPLTSYTRSGMKGCVVVASNATAAFAQASMPTRKKKTAAVTFHDTSKSYPTQQGKMRSGGFASESCLRQAAMPRRKHGKVAVEQECDGVAHHRTCGRSCSEERGTDSPDGAPLLRSAPRLSSTWQDHVVEPPPPPRRMCEECAALPHRPVLPCFGGCPPTIVHALSLTELRGPFFPFCPLTACLCTSNRKFGSIVTAWTTCDRCTKPTIAPFLQRVLSPASFATL